MSERIITKGRVGVEDCLQCMKIQLDWALSLVLSMLPFPCLERAKIHLLAHSAPAGDASRSECKQSMLVQISRIHCAHNAQDHYRPLFDFPTYHTQLLKSTTPLSPRVRTLPYNINIPPSLLNLTLSFIVEQIRFIQNSPYKDIAQAQMADRYNPPQRRPANSTANYSTPLTLTSNTNIGIGTNTSASRVTTSTAFSPEQGQRSAINIHAPFTHPSLQPHTTLRAQMQALPSPSSASTKHSSSHLRGDSTPYMPMQALNLNSPSSTTTNLQNLTLPHQTSHPQTTGLANMPASQPTWPTPSPRFQKPLSSQPTPTSANTPSSTQKQPKPSVKHLTCYFWSEFGHCQWSSTECLYAHWYTGKVASAPVQIEVGSKSSHHLITSSPCPLPFFVSYNDSFF